MPNHTSAGSLTPELMTMNQLLAEVEDLERRRTQFIGPEYRQRWLSRLYARAVELKMQAQVCERIVKLKQLGDL